MRRALRDARGFTLLELLIALTIVSALLVIAFGGMRVALAAWRRGEDRAEVHEQIRGVALNLARALGASYPYRAARGDAPEIVLLFAGTDHRVEFVTEAAPFPLSAPIAFTAVTISLDEGEEPGLVIRERALPNRDPFTKGAVVFRDPGVTSLKIEYLGDDGWTDTWDGQQQAALPHAVRLAVGATLDGRPVTLPPLTVSLWTATPS